MLPYVLLDVFLSTFMSLCVFFFACFCLYLLVYLFMYFFACLFISLAYLVFCLSIYSSISFIYIVELFLHVFAPQGFLPVSMIFSCGRDNRFIFPTKRRNDSSAWRDGDLDRPHVQDTCCGSFVSRVCGTSEHLTPVNGCHFKR